MSKSLNSITHAEHEVVQSIARLLAACKADGSPRAARLVRVAAGAANDLLTHYTLRRNDDTGELDTMPEFTLAALNTVISDYYALAEFISDHQALAERQALTLPESYYETNPANAFGAIAQWASETEKARQVEATRVWREDYERRKAAEVSAEVT